MSPTDEHGRLQLEADEADLRLFLQDADEQLALLDQDLIRLEQGPDDEILQGIFRAAHTLKGSSATIGHTKMAELTHAMESVLDGVRKHTLPVTTPLIDTLLSGLDGLRVLLQEVVTLEDSGMDFGPLAAELLALRDGETPAESAGDAAAGAAPAEAATAEPDTAPAEDLRAALAEAIASQQGKGRAVFQVQVRLRADCVMPAVRYFQCLVELNANGEVLGSTPSAEAIEREEASGDLRAIFSTLRDAAEVRELLAPVMDLESVEITPVEEAPSAVPDERTPGSLASDAAYADGKRIIDLGPGARGKPPEEQLRMAAQKLAGQGKSVRIDVERLDALMNLTGELVIDRGRLLALAKRFGAADVEPALRDSLDDTTAHLGLVTTELQDQVMKSRMQPVANVFNRFPRMVRDLAKRAGKQVDLQISGEDTELDRSVIEEIGDPMIHLLRNAVDHGLETLADREAAGKPPTGVLSVSSGHEESAIVIRVRDDGRGIDPERIKAKALERGVLSAEAAERLSTAELQELVLLPGFSTAEVVTDVSGRGVGMDIVKTNIEKLNGTLSMHSEVGVGTTFTIRVPLTLAVIQGLVLRVRESLLVVPLSSVTETLKLEAGQLRNVHGGGAIQLRGQVLPIVDLTELLWGVPWSRDGEAADDTRYVVAVQTAGEHAGLMVDDLLGQQEVVIKSLGSLLRGVPGISGATLMGDEVALIADIPGILALHQNRKEVAA